MLPDCPVNTDEVELHVDSAVIRVIRRLTYNLPHEVSAFIPRAEIRRRRYENGQLAWEEEVILNSLTVVHSPQRPPTGERPPATGPASAGPPAGPVGKSRDGAPVPATAAPFPESAGVKNEMSAPCPGDPPTSAGKLRLHLKYS
ncbi:hypothetical protein [Moorella sp. Hama-1]|uniref:hypothetical protein n=1 Tax=Moorella sp. Hama-1 TaxID=2138101 RepID=UPI00137A42B8|nr:hypothetical protein [Moorella sp. Hama-1]BCV20129.1 hypothetical protein hamaS1_01980 [Moorella sp. Hama-1]